MFFVFSFYWPLKGTLENRCPANLGKEFLAWKSAIGLNLNIKDLKNSFEGVYFSVKVLIYGLKPN